MEDFYCVSWNTLDLDNAWNTLATQESSFVEDGIYVSIPASMTAEDEVHESSFSDDLSGGMHPLLGFAFVLFLVPRILLFPAFRNSIFDCSADEEILFRLRELEDWPYDHANAPKIGPQYQCSLDYALNGRVMIPYWKSHY